MEEVLIENVRLREVLYNIKSINYRDKKIRQEAWEEIGKDMNITGNKIQIIIIMTVMYCSNFVCILITVPINFTWNIISC